MEPYLFVCSTESSPRELPREMYQEIFKFLSVTDLFQVRLVCKLWREILNQQPLVLKGADEPQKLLGLIQQKSFSKRAKVNWCVRRISQELTSYDYADFIRMMGSLMLLSLKHSWYEEPMPTLKYHNKIFYVAFSILFFGGLYGSYEKLKQFLNEQSSHHLKALKGRVNRLARDEKVPVPLIPVRNLKNELLDYSDFVNGAGKRGKVWLDFRVFLQTRLKLMEIKRTVNEKNKKSTWQKYILPVMITPCFRNNKV